MSALETYSRKLEEAEALHAQSDRRHESLANLRMAVFVMALVLLFMVLRRGLDILWLGLPLLLFSALVVAQSRVEVLRGKAAKSRDYFRWCLDRVRGDWLGTGTTREDLCPEEHPYAVDLSLFGHASLMDRLGRTATEVGVRRLSRWLLEGAEAQDVRQRQAAVRELGPSVEFRARLHSAASSERGELNPEAVQRWAGSSLPALADAWWLKALVYGLSVAGPLSLAYWFAVGNVFPLLMIAAAQVWLLRWRGPELMQIVGPMDRVSEELGALGRVLEAVAEQGWEAPWLSARAQRLGRNEGAALDAIRRLQRIAQWWELRLNQLMIPVVVLTLLPFHVGWRFRRWHAEFSGNLADWFDALADIDAIGVVSHIHYDQPDWVFPEMLDEGGSFEGRQMRHPLVPGCVPNDLRLSRKEGPRLVIVSGSNMAGKSTLLRTVGVSVVLAQAGAPVAAEALTLGTFNLAATLYVQDSVSDGRSRFYAELLRLKAVVRLASEGKCLLYLLDELLAGTNSHDRAVGASGLVEALIGGNAVGLLTTHDLALTKLDGGEPEMVRNVHLEDTLEGDVLQFDYTLKEGVVQRSNAIALMKALRLLPEEGRDGA